jgi:hypothetical protein
VTVRERLIFRAPAFRRPFLLMTAIFLALFAFLVASAPAIQAPLAATAHNNAPPPGLAAPVLEQIAAKGITVKIEKGPVAEFWFVTSLKVNGAGPTVAWSDVPEGSLVGAVRLSADYPDIRGRVIKAGVYTLRYGIQPDNGDHLGVSPFRDFLLLSPAAGDGDPGPKGHDGTIELSKASVGGSHPGVWSIDPPGTKAPALQLHKTDLGHDAVIVEIPIERAGKSVGAIHFGIVLIGKIEA